MLIGRKKKSIRKKKKGARIIMSKLIDLTGQTFGLLTVMYMADDIGGDTHVQG